MSTFLAFYVLPVLVAAVVIVLIMGLLALNKPGDEARERSNKLMRWRVGLQSVTIVLALIVVVMHKMGY